MTKFPIRSKPPSPEPVATLSQTLPSRHRDTGPLLTASPPAARLPQNGTVDDPPTAPPPHTNLPMQSPQPHPPLNRLSTSNSPSTYEAVAPDPDAEARQTYRRSLRFLAEDVRARLASRGRHAHVGGRLYDRALARSARDLERLVRCYQETLDPDLDPLHPRPRFESPTHYLLAIKRFWTAHDRPAAAARYLPCWELMAGRRLTAREQADMGLDEFLYGEIGGRGWSAGVGRWGVGEMRGGNTGEEEDVVRGKRLSWQAWEEREIRREKRRRRG
ncbi:hypothetical protein MMC34_006894 [Xylographa carneopallida]|nr:hypothetical protein [Xylographa carneopallida]